MNVAIKQIFTDARSHHHWTDKEISPDSLQQIYETMKWGPTAFNANPARLLFLTTKKAKEKLLPSLSGSNIEQVKAAPVTVIVAQDEKFYDHLTELFPTFDGKAYFEANPEAASETSFRNSSLQGAYALIAARALGFDVCPMSGFDSKKLNETFFQETTYKSNFIFTLGYGKKDKLYPRGPRLSFEKACKIL